MKKCAALFIVLLSLTVLSLPLLSMRASADESKKLDLSPHWPMMKMGDHKLQDAVETKESEVEIGGERYRRIEYQGKFFYLRMQNQMVAGLDDEAYCRSPASIADPVRLVEAAVKVTKRTRLFVEGLTKRCGTLGRQGGMGPIENSAQPKMSLDLAPRGGIAITPEDGKEKKIYFDPGIYGGGFSSEF